MSTVRTSDTCEETAQQLERVQTLNKLFGQIGDLTPLPDMAIKILQVTSDDDSTSDDLVAVVEEDPAMVIKVLRTVNSAYTGLGQEVSDLKSAVNLLGRREIRNIALTMKVSGLFDGKRSYREYSRRGLWNHSMAVATIARMVCRVCEKKCADEAFLAGLVHDIGWILMDEHLTEKFHAILNRVHDGVSTHDVEHEIVGFDHAQLGEFVAWQWQLPEAVTVAIGHHHAPADYDGPHRELLTAVSVANYLASRRSEMALGCRTVPPVPRPLLDEFGLSNQLVEQMWVELDGSIDEARSLAASL